jgi:hypothetical protein
MSFDALKPKYLKIQFKTFYQTYSRCKNIKKSVKKKKKNIDAGLQKEKKK